MLSARPTVTRTSRYDPHGAALESVAAEFALLAQRRARMARQLDLLGRQICAAQTSLDAVQSRMSMLALRMDGIDPSLRPVAEPQPAAAAPADARRPAILRTGATAAGFAGVSGTAGAAAALPGQTADGGSPPATSTAPPPFSA